MTGRRWGWLASPPRPSCNKGKKNLHGNGHLFASGSPEDLLRFQADPSKLQEYLHSEADDPPGCFDVEKACHANAVR